jgi:hypothetical protein
MDRSFSLVAKWLTDNAVLLGAAVSVTALLGFFARPIISWCKRKANRKPMLMFIERMDLDNHGGHSYSRALYVENTGNVLANNIVRRIEHDPSGIARSGETLCLGPLSPGQKESALYARHPSMSSVPILDDPQFQVTVECDDNHGAHYISFYKDRQQSNTKRTRKRSMLPKNADRI